MSARRMRSGMRTSAAGALAIVGPGRRIGGGEDDRVVLLLHAELRFVLEIDVAPPTEQDQRNVQGQRCACDTDLRTELTDDAQMPEEGAAVPDEQHDSADQYDENQRIPAGACQTRTCHGPGRR